MKKIFITILVVVLILFLQFFSQEILLFLQNTLNQDDGFLVPNGFFYGGAFSFLLIFIFGIYFLFWLISAVKKVYKKLNIKKIIILFFVFSFSSLFIFIPINLFFSQTVFSPDKILLKNLFSRKNINTEDIAEINFEKFNGTFVSCEKINLILKNGEKIEINIPYLWKTKVLSSLNRIVEYGTEEFSDFEAKAKIKLEEAWQIQKDAATKGNGELGDFFVCVDNDYVFSTYYDKLNNINLRGYYVNSQTGKVRYVDANDRYQLTKIDFSKGYKGDQITNTKKNSNEKNFDDELIIFQGGKVSGILKTNNCDSTEKTMCAEQFFVEINYPEKFKLDLGSGYDSKIDKKYRQYINKEICLDVGIIKEISEGYKVAETVEIIDCNSLEIPEIDEFKKIIDGKISSREFMKPRNNECEKNLSKRVLENYSQIELPKKNKVQDNLRG